MRAGRNRGARRLTPQGVRDVCARRGAEAGVAPFTPHDFRRTAMGDLLDAGADIVSVQKILGHASPATTALYDRRPLEARRAAVLRRTIPS